MSSGIPKIRRGFLADRVYSGATGIFAYAVVATLLFVLAILLQRAWPAISEFGISFLWETHWNPAGQEFGAGPYIYGTLASSLIGLAVAVPLSVLTAIALTDLLPKKLATPLGFMIETLAAVPSIILGVWGLAVLVPMVRDMSGGATFGPSLLAAGLVLAIMALPIVTAVSRDVLAAVPRAEREAAYALGATRWEVTWRVVLPRARPGLFAASILGLGRAIGETMAVIMVIGNQPLFPKSLYDPAATIASVIANEFGDPSGPLHTASLVELGLILLLMSLLLNMMARFVVRVFERRLGVEA